MAAEREVARWKRGIAADEVAIPAQYGLVEVNEDAETVVVSLAKEGGSADAPDEPATVYGTVVRARDHERQPIIPAWLRNAEQRKQFARWYAGYLWYLARFQAVKVFTRYLWLTALWSVVGVGKLTYKQLCWMWLTEQHALRQAAANSKGGADEWMKLHREAKATRKYRGSLLLAELIALVAAVLVLTHLAPLWGQVIAVVVAVTFLAYFGQPADKPILVRTSSGDRFVKLTAEQVRAALCAIGITAIKEPSQLTFPAPGIHKDGPGWLARVNLPQGVEAVEVLERRGKLSSALRLPVDQVWPSVGPEHTGQMDLWVGYAPASKMGQPRWSLASPTARTSVFDEHEFGTDERQRPVKTSLFARNVLIGGQPGSGKSYGAMALVWIGALDPTCELKIAEFKGTGDFMDFAPLCSTYICGVSDSELDAGAALIRWGLAEAERRGKRLEKAKKAGHAPEGKVTPELAARPGSGLHPVLIVVDEAHELFLHSKEAAGDAEKLVKRGRALGLMFVLATQIPDAKSVPPSLTRCVTLRWCLAVQDYWANDAILGTGMHKKGMTATPYRPGLDAGWGIFAGLASDGPVRSHFPNEKDRAVMLARATELRGGRIVGNQEQDAAPRPFLADVLYVVSERGDHWEVIAERLAELDPCYLGITAEIVSARVRALGVPQRQIKSGGVNRNGVRPEDVREAMKAITQ